jgi:hypothetical protein
MRDSFTLVREHLGKAAERRKDYYDMRVGLKKYPAGSWVYCLVPRRRRNRSHKCQSFYEGPYLVIRQIGEVNLLIQRSGRSKPVVVHIDKLKPCYEEGLRSWLETEHELGLTAQSRIEYRQATSDPTADDTSDRHSADNIVTQTSRPKRYIVKPARYRVIMRQ